MLRGRCIVQIALNRPSPSKARAGKERAGLARKEASRERRTVPELLAELKQIIKVTGIREVYDFIEEFEAGAGGESGKQQIAGLQTKLDTVKLELEKSKLETNR